MILKYVLLLLLLQGIVSCKPSHEDSILPVIDLNREYPVKRMDIHEMADVEYIPLETTDNSLISTLAYTAVSDKYIVIGEAKFFEIFLFDRQGKFIRKIGRRGNGPGEYLAFHDMDVDFDKEEVYIYSLGNIQKMWVYSLNGKFLRDFKYEVSKKRLDLKRIDNYDENFLLTYNDQYWPHPYPEYKREADKTPYYLINKQTGGMKIAHKRLVISNPVPPYLDRMVKGPSGFYNWTVGYEINFLARNGKDDILLVENSLDTLYTFKNHELHPAIVRTPSTSSMKEKRFISPCALTDSFFIYRRVILDNDLDKQENLFYDKRDFPAYIFNRNTGEIFQWEIYDSNVSTELSLSERLPNGFPGNGIFYSTTKKNQIVSFYYLHQMGKTDKSRYKGKFKEAYDSTKEEDNPILVIYNFK